SAVWLDQPIEPYTVDRQLSDGDEFPAGDTMLRVLHTPGHTLGHISLYLPENEILLCGDAIHRDDVPWISIYREGAGALERALESLERLMRLPIRWACSGHGPAIENPKAAIQTGLRRYERWLAQPENMGWHACKRVFTYGLMLTDGMAASDIPAYLTSCGWYRDITRGVFHADPAELVAPLLAEMVRSGAAEWRDDRLVPTVAYNAPPTGWAATVPWPADWPPVTLAAMSPGAPDRSESPPHARGHAP
ncbi:MAG: MBL fold metallo-hydrolase, partial [Ktedonobacterales bacterium]